MAENLSGESFVFGYVLSISTDDGLKEYEGAIRIEAWGETEVLIRTEIPDTELQPTDFELIPIKVEQPVTATLVPDPQRYASIIGYHLEIDPALPKIHGIVKNHVSGDLLRSVRVEGTFYVGDRAGESSNVVERDVQPDEERGFVIRYFRGDEASRIDGYEVKVIEVYL